MEFFLFLAQASTEPQSDPIIPMVLFFAVVGVAFWFLILRPQKVEQKKREDKLSTIKKGDKIVTAGGIWGKVTNANKTDTVEVEIAKNVKVVFNRSSIAVVNDDKDTEGKKDDSKKEDSKK